MYQSVIRDPGGNRLIRIQPDVCGQNTTVVNGSILIVPPGTTAFVAVNGTISRPYGPGRYELFTGVDPFFVRLRNIMTRGDPGVSVSVFFISTDRSTFIKIGTGEFPFRENRFNITMKALASCSLTFSIASPLRVLNKLVGSYSSVFSDDDIQPCIEQMILTPVRESISTEISRLDPSEFNSNLTVIGNRAVGRIRTKLLEYGIKLERFDLTAINIPDSEMRRLYELEQEKAKGINRTDIERDNLDRIYNGNVMQRTVSEMMTGVPSRGQPYSNTPSGAPAGSNGGMMPMMAQMMALSQLLPALREPMSDMMRHTDMFGSNSGDSQSSTSTADSAPPLPGRFKTCPSCNGNVARSSSACPICGYRF